ncbi:acetyl/propionyl/methylcrotonyl-CoA carboxylase subunit alpha [Alicycliphilus denitrificans]|jgi:propionyl-CoA carboxylase alpha chain/3-methylcrotonyl-CoA carboxylase alpha subunit|uniref:Methylcrotonoyl-CoA carboxylase, Pyruvate carboxylase n=1 Tax=Alicycliphilus denitrificans (strain DSM 14773 / CIP 107495 / K601) TaxID=596154 RepID=F4G6E4_ALIDK|nr:biotin carboxylase N-terminal domain-containing protein [Alicycliphilus denitrificans]AEB84253.1 Methylcrotonoyl-CoA carboxylase, Pyruvate carboxylase [Alicycliphilus denitrificans K601]
MFKRVLIANRGEIACRIARTCRAMGIEYVGLYTDVDAAAPHLEGTAARVRIGTGPAAQSYLDIERIVAAARETGCDAVHPGYGFLSENSRFAAAVAAAGLTFVGPKPETIATLGDKARAKALMEAARVPVVPGGGDASDDPETVEAMVRRVGFPVLLKPSAGGGGKGMRVIADAAEVREAVASAIRVARSSFGDGRLIVERFIEQPRHIEVQVFGDSHGNVAHLFERECSLQRRHQKVVEEAPAPNLPEAVRSRLVEAAVRGARSVGYLNAGTFEFIVARDFQFYFLEVNTRLQVEHPVTESVTGLDLVEWQLRVAAGESLPLAQERIRCDGHAVECRIYAEDPAHDFRPSPGEVGAVRWPRHVRVEAGIAAGGVVPPFYDPMVAKLVTHAPSRETALARMVEALDETALMGLTTNIGYLRRVLVDAGVRAAQVHTRYLDEHGSRFATHGGTARAAACAATIGPRSATARHPWACAHVADRASLDPQAPLGRVHLWAGEQQLAAALQARTADGFRVGVDDASWDVAAAQESDGLHRGRIGAGTWFAQWRQGLWELQVHGDRFPLQPARTRRFDEAATAGLAVAPMSGTIAALPVAAGERVAEGATVAVVEAMKMEHRVVAAREGIVRALAFRVGDTVKAGELIVDIE